MPIVQVGDRQIHYWIGRNDLLVGREVILFIHGAGGGQFTWNRQKAFFEKEFNPIVMELPGHGESRGKGEEEIGRYAEDVHAFVKALHLPKLFLVGHSMGGAIVQTLSLTYPDLIKGIVLVGTGARLKVFPMILNGIKDHFEETVKRITRFAYSRKAPPEMVEEGVSELMRCQPEVLYGDFLACDRFDIITEVERIDLPALVLCGDEDELTPTKYSQFLHSQIKGAEIAVLPNSGHMVMIETPQAFNEKVRAFLAKLYTTGCKSSST